MNLVKCCLLIFGLLLSSSMTSELTARHNDSVAEHHYTLPSIDGLDRRLTVKDNAKLIFDESAPPPTPHRSVLFLSDSQNEAQYEPIFEFGQTPLTALDSSETCDPTPWYISRCSKGRLSGWKDGNSLYKAKITYHA